MDKFYITTAIPYVNAAPHIGHALEFVQADVIRRHHQALGEETLLLSGGDENALKNVQAAEEAGVAIQAFVDKNAELFRELGERLGVHFDVFQKGSDQLRHHPSSQELWRRCAAAGDIYKKSYEGLYCVGCEAFYTPGELNEAGECFEHPGKKLERVHEENYFFRLSKYRGRLIDLISSGELTIIPETRKNEVLAFLNEPLQDISISRTNERAKSWGVPVPDDPSQRIYVWFDALNIYQSGVGFSWDEELYKKWWPADVHLIGKGIIRFHAVYWPAFLLSAKLPLPKALSVHGYITVDGQKMSKTLGNVIDPFTLVEKYGTDAVRYYLLREIPSTEDGDFSVAKFEQRYNGDLANGLGNFVARVLALAAKSRITNYELRIKNQGLSEATREATFAYERAIEEFRLHEALGAVWELIHAGDAYINAERPWVDEKPEVIGTLLALLEEVTRLLGSFLPATAEELKKRLSTREPGGPLFPRLR